MKAATLSSRCYDCFRPKSLCFCSTIPRIENRTPILILQHVGERSHPFNTARIVNRALQRCELVSDHNRRFSSRDLPLMEGAGILYPSHDAKVLSELTPAQWPRQLVMIDGTWHQAKTVYRDTSQLQQLPCFRLKPATPGQYRIRLEPDELSLSTVEAVVQALQTLEPECDQLSHLLAAFDRMVTDQLEQRGNRHVQRQRKIRSDEPTYVPRSLLHDPRFLVVAYGEASPRRSGRPSSQRQPLNWFAERLGTGERFARVLQPPFELSDDELKHLRMSRREVETGETYERFMSDWRDFLNPRDQVVVYHQRTYQLAHQGGPNEPRCLSLKSIFGNLRPGFQSLEELLQQEGLSIPAADHIPRGELRLQMALRMVRHLRDQHSTWPDPASPKDVGCSHASSIDRLENGK